jgi:hypothetical protein
VGTKNIVVYDTALHDRYAHKQLQADLIDHIWQKFGHTYRQNN